ncbi:hypothetical protein [Polaribacter sp. MED152]|uniref:hypothetical protein n=1 Tax=Polaribacter sp. MED152 TaxID=313598 RepID=UPI000068C524|nr:hypothetical protein [Polaribacter sp. MED152]EAQ42517.1 hypothetical protein MED152_07345 [Polaribacter sp. MED152]
MDKELSDLKKILQSNFIEIGNKDSVNALKNNDESLFLSITECGLKWQKKKIESLFEVSSINVDDFESEVFKKCIESEYISECLKPSKKNFYFINLSGLYYLESKKNKNLKNLVVKKLQDNFYQEVRWVLKDEEKLIVSLLIVFNAFNEEKAFEITTKNETKIWEFMKEDLSEGLVEIGICKSFQDKIDAKSTKYASGKNFLSGQPSLLSRTGLFIPNNGRYYLELIADADYDFLVSLLFDGFGYSEKLAYVELLEKLGRELFMKSILEDIFDFNDKLRSKILH